MPEICPSASNNGDFAVGTVWTTRTGYALAFTLEGNLELRNPSQKLLWESKTRDRGAKIVSMQTDGNLVIYDSAGKALWSTHTMGYPGAFLSVQDDGNMVVYERTRRALWATGTSETAKPPRPRIEQPPLRAEPPRPRVEQSRPRFEAQGNIYRLASDRAG